MPWCSHRHEQAYGGGEGSLEISPGGAMYLFGTGDTTGYSSLAGVSYPLGA